MWSSKKIKTMIEDNKLAFGLDLVSLSFPHFSLQIFLMVYHCILQPKISESNLVKLANKNMKGVNKMISR